MNITPFGESLLLDVVPFIYKSVEKKVIIAKSDDLKAHREQMQETI